MMLGSENWTPLGIGLVEIAARIGRTKGAIRARVEKLNIAVARDSKPDAGRYLRNQDDR
jgi:hypothetical protein